MKYFAQSAFEYMHRQAEQQGNSGKLMFMVPSLPPDVVVDIGDRFTGFYCERPDSPPPVIKVAAPLISEWRRSGDPAIRSIAQNISEKGWSDDRENLTGYRNITIEGGGGAIVLPSRSRSRYGLRQHGGFSSL